MIQTPNRVTLHLTAAGPQDLLLHGGPGLDQGHAQDRSILRLGLGLDQLVGL